MSDFPIKRTPEQGHTAQCQAKCLITAIQNARDAVVSDHYRLHIQSSELAYGAILSDRDGNANHGTIAPAKAHQGASFDFRIMAQNNAFLAEVDDMLADGIMECICPENVEW